MKIASITETKNQLSALLDRVRNGETVLIVDRGRPVARLESAVSGAADALDGRLARLERQGILRRGAGSRFDKELLKSRLPKPHRSGSALRALLEERREGR